MYESVGCSVFVPNGTNWISRHTFFRVKLKIFLIKKRTLHYEALKKGMEILVCRKTFQYLTKIKIQILSGGTTVSPTHIQALFSLNYIVYDVLKVVIEIIRLISIVMKMFLQALKNNGSMKLCL